MEATTDITAVIARAEGDAAALIRVLEAETAALERHDIDGMALLADEKRAYGQRLEQAFGQLRQGAAIDGVGELEALLQTLSEVVRRNMEVLSVWRDAGQRVLGIVAEVAVDHAEAVVGYGPRGRRVGAAVRPVNLNGTF